MGGLVGDIQSLTGEPTLFFQVACFSPFGMERPPCGNMLDFAGTCWQDGAVHEMTVFCFDEMHPFGKSALLENNKGYQRLNHRPGRRQDRER